MLNPLLDFDFLKQLDLENNKATYAKMVLLTQDEMPIQEIQGKITQGSVNIDGASAVRRSCSLTMIAPKIDLDDSYWALKNKFKLEIGVENNIDSRYPDIIWFKYGIFVFTSLNMVVGVNNYTINLQGKDKMCLLNGEVGGTITASTDFGKIDEWKKLESGEVVKESVSLTIPNIIKMAVNTFGNEKLENIIINDIDEYAVELLEYRGNKPLYMIRDADSGQEVNMTLDGNKEYYDSEGNTIKLNEIKHYYNPNPLVDQTKATTIYSLNSQQSNNKGYNVVKVELGQTAGYRSTDLIYPGELVANIGESLTSILDKIKNTFSNYEYFYDIDGRFVFQKKKTYLTESFNNLKKSDGEVYAEAAVYTSAATYSLENGVLLTAFNNNPSIQNIKNDFSIWGKKTSATSQDLPVHLRYAIDEKPSKYKTFDGTEYLSSKVDWREIIYQMALDYYKYSTNDDFLLELANNNPQYPTGKTGYEQYYIDLQAFWRQIYNPDAIGKQGMGGYIELELDEIYQTTKRKYSTKDGFAWEVEYAPETLNFWLDFLNPYSEIGKYSIKAIGHRPKADNNDKTTVIKNREIPNVLFIPRDEYDETIGKISQQLSGYTYMRLQPQIENYFTISAQGISALDQFNVLMEQHLQLTESVTLTAVPIYHLEPNTRIHVYDENTNTNGDYIISKITIPLQYNGTTSITATKAVDRIY